MSVVFLSCVFVYFPLNIKNECTICCLSSFIIHKTLNVWLEKGSSLSNVALYFHVGSTVTYFTRVRKPGSPLVAMQGHFSIYFLIFV